MLDTVVMSGNDVCCSVVFGTLVGVFVFSVIWSDLLMTSAISCPLWSSVYECQRVECVFTSLVRTECGMFVMIHRNIGYHIYADDTQLYISFKCKDPFESLTRLNMCISDIRVWMIKNKLKINDSKTEYIIFRSPLLKQNLSDLSVSVGDMQVSPSSKVRDLGVVFDQYLTFHDHISGICKSTHFHLRDIGRIRTLQILMPLHNLFMP